MNYLKLVRNAMRLHDQERFTGNQLLLYVVLVEQFNRAGEGDKWPDSLRFQDSMLSALTGVSINKMKEFRLDLQTRRLIDFKEPGQGIRTGTQYWLGEKRSSETDEVKPKRSSERSSEKSSVSDDLLPEKSSETDEVTDKDRQKDHQKSRQKDRQKLTRSYIYINPNLPNHQTTKQLLSVAHRDVVAVRMAAVWILAHKQPPPKVELEPVGTVKKKTPQVPARPPTIVTQIRRLIETKSPGYYWRAKDGGAARDIAAKLKNAIEQKSQNGLGTVTEATDEDIINALTVMINRTSELPAYFHFTDLPALNGKFNEIITQLRKRQSGQPAANGRPVAPAHRTQEQRASFLNDVFAAIDSVVGG